MKTGFSAAAAFAFLVSSQGLFAQTSTDKPADPSTYGSGESARCSPMSGEAKAQCLKDEGAKTENKSDDSASGSSSVPSSDGASSPSAPADSSPATSGDSSGSSGASSSAPAGSSPADSGSTSGSVSK